MGTHDAVFVRENLLARLDVVPVSPRIRRIVTVLILAWFIESFDIGLTGGLIVALKDSWNISASEAGLIGTSGTVGIVIALVPAGRLADTFGRKRMLMYGIAVFTIATLMAGLAWNMPSLLVFRFLAGLGAGAMFPLPYLLMGEYVNREKRATFVGWGEFILKMGYAFPSLVAIFAIETFDSSAEWRVPLIAAGITAVLVPIIWVSVPESPRFLLRKGRSDEVRRFVEALEADAGVPHDDTLRNPSISFANQGANDKRARGRELFRPPYLLRTFVAVTALMSPFVLWYPMLNYAPSIFESMGATSTQGLFIIASMMAVGGIGAVAMGRYGDRYGRKRVHITYALLSAIGLVIMGQGTDLPIWLLVFAAVLVSLFGFGNFTVPKVYLSEQYPTRLRGTGAATGEMVVRLLCGVVLAYFIPTLLASMGAQLLFLIMATAMIVLILPMLFFGIETARQSLEAADPDLVVAESNRVEPAASDSGR